MQDAFLLAYRGLVDYVAPLMIIKPLVRQQMTRYVHWRTFEWHWETLAELIDYRSEILPQFQVRRNENSFLFFHMIISELRYR